MKERLDQLLQKRGLAPSREKAKALIMEGIVFVNGQREDKAGSSFPDAAVVELRGNPLPYVSRGGLKLEKAVKGFGIDLHGKIMDMGASTGGFTDCMLQHGAAKVFAVDVGYGQLDWKLRRDARVVVLERTNARYLSAEQIPDPPDFASADLAFISLSKVLQVAYDLLKEEGEMVCLVKPQFEAGREKVRKKGVVKDPAVHEEVLERIMKLSRKLGFGVLHLDYSPIKGPEGNIEYLLHIQKGTREEWPDISAVVKQAQLGLRKE